MGPPLADGADLEGPEAVTLSEHAQTNREVWAKNAAEFREPGKRNWAQPEITWGIWHLPESEIGALPVLEGKDVVELGCGTAYISSWLARRGANVVGVDLSPEQLATARELQAEHGIEFSLIEASAEDVPLPAASFDLVVSEYGASIWADPYLWIPEAARLLRPGGELVFLTNGLILELAWLVESERVGEMLVYDYFGFHRLEDPQDGSIVFQLPYGEWIRLFRANGLEVEDLIELQPPEGADPGRWDFVSNEWARKWPSEEIWKARKPA